MRGTCADIEGTVQAIEGSQSCCKAYKGVSLEKHKWIFWVIVWDRV